MFLGYNTNGLAHHDPLDALALLAEIGYQGVALTLDHALLPPSCSRTSAAVEKMREALERHRLRSVIETGARFLLDYRHKHEPTLMTADASARQRRIEFLCHAMDMAQALGSDCVSLWSGVLREELPEELAWQRLLSGLHPLLQQAERRNMVLAFEPEPGMFIDTMSRFEQLTDRIDSPCFRLTLDVGHLHCLGEVPVAEQIRRWGSMLANVHIEDMRAGVHEHLMFGEGQMDFPPIVDALRDVGYPGGLYVELSRHSHEGPSAARRAYDFLSRLPSQPGQ